MKILITTVGTSILEHAGLTPPERTFSRDPGKKRELPYAHQLYGDTELRLKNKLLSHLKTKNLDKDADIDQTSAEIKSVYKIVKEYQTKYGKEEFGILLISSDTLNGRICSETLERYFSEHLSINARILKINDLQVEDSARFEKGIKNLVDGIYNIINQTHQSNIVLNPTGGFKSLIPYITLIGMIKKIPVYYVFEQTQTLLTLLPYPIELSIQIEPDQRKILVDLLYPNGMIPLPELRNKLRNHEVFSSILIGEEIDHQQYISLNGIGKVIMENYLAIHPEPLTKSSIEPDKKDWLRELKQEPHFKQLQPIREKLKSIEYVEHFSYIDGCNPDEKSIKCVPNFMNPGESYIKLMMGGIVMKVKTTAKHPRQLDLIAEIIKNSLF